MVISYCASILLLLIISSMVMQFLQAKKREKFVRKVDRSWLLPHHQARWHSIENSFDPFFKDFRKLQVVKKNLDVLPEDLAMEFDQYRILSKATISITLFMLLFGSTAHFFCN